MRLLAFAASLRAGSLNGQLLDLACLIAEANDVEVERVKFSDLESPPYNEDLRQMGRYQEGAERFRQRLMKADTFTIASPEYNFSMPGALKKSIDRVSKYSSQPFRGKPGLLLSASPPLVGGNRCLWQLRIPLEALLANIYPDMFSLAQADQAFKEGGTLKDLALQGRSENLIKAFLVFVAKLRSG
jgi:NAD(P)H-dependent FMN reductase